jgi:hypothetical protein
MAYEYHLYDPLHVCLSEPTYVCTRVVIYVYMCIPLGIPTSGPDVTFLQALNTLQLSTSCSTALSCSLSLSLSLCTLLSETLSLLFVNARMCIHVSQPTLPH